MESSPISGVPPAPPVPPGGDGSGGRGDDSRRRRRKKRREPEADAAELHLSGDVPGPDAADAEATAHDDPDGEPGAGDDADRTEAGVAERPDGEATPTGGNEGRAAEDASDGDAPRGRRLDVRA